MFLNGLFKEITWKTNKRTVGYEGSLSILWKRAPQVLMAAYHLFLGADHDVCILVCTAVLYCQLRQLSIDIGRECRMRYLFMCVSLHFHYTTLLVYQLRSGQKVDQAERRGKPSALVHEVSGHGIYGGHWLYGCYLFFISSY